MSQSKINLMTSSRFYYDVIAPQHTICGNTRRKSCRPRAHSPIFRVDEKSIMDANNQQPNVRRRLNFDDMDIETGLDGGMHGNGGEWDSTLPRVPGTGERDYDVGLEETDTESTPGSPPRNPMGGIRILYQGYGRPNQIARPRPGFACVIARDHDGLTTVYYVPLGQVQLALRDPEETESESDFDGDEELN